MPQSCPLQRVLVPELLGIQQTYPEMSVREVVDMMRNNQLGMTRDTAMIRSMATSSSRVIQAMNNLTRQGGLYDQMLEVAKKVNFGGNRVEIDSRKWTSDYVSPSPDIQELKTIADGIYAQQSQVMSRGGQGSDISRGWAESMTPVYTSYDALARSIERDRKVVASVARGDIETMTNIAEGRGFDTLLQSSGANDAAAPAAGGTTAAPAAGGTGQLPRVRSRDEMNALPKGTRFIGPDGKEWIAPGPR